MTQSKSHYFTSESVSEGHPDKVCDQISDVLVDLFLQKDPYARTAIETVATTDYLGLVGEIRCAAPISEEEIEQAVRNKIKDIGYNQDGFHWNNLRFNNLLHSQSEDIAVGVDSGDDKDEGAGDQGIMFGYACTETPAYMPAAIHYAHNILKAISQARRSGELKQLGPDAKSQVTLAYENDKPVGTHSIVLSTQHDEGLTQNDVADLVTPYIRDVIPEGWMCGEQELYINPTGRFVIGGPVGDAGLTGRKIIVDTYGGAAPHGGGAFSGKDPSKVDRSAAYAARYLAKNIVAAGYADKCTLQLSYAIGVSKPLSIYIDMAGTGRAPENEIIRAVRTLMDLSPRGIREHLALNKPIYEATAAYGHFGREEEEGGAFSWEKLDLVKPLQEVLG